MARRDLAAGVLAVLGHGFAWVSHTEQIWMPMAGAYVRYVAPATGLPDLRGPFLFITLVYIGLRIGDLWDRRDDLEDTI
ncbi:MULTISPECIES: hypothetical protein [Halorussus]|uniref:hypothetical protein n=1 Tax=Halorussus TaxID=1070314 RepID=UPI000E20EEDF|nr:MULTISPECIES: hypothetical protein [Halorussus]NHN59822.1 hypothetical protein [Halorussus sp. JP-T4]